MAEPTKIAFFGVKSWEREVIEKEISRLDSYGVGIFEQEVQDDIKLAGEYEVLSVFIYCEMSKKVLDKLPNLRFDKPLAVKKSMAKKFLLGLVREKIVVDREKCVRCGVCARKCPMKAITLNPCPVIDTKKCIRCFCCVEICSENALSEK